MFYDDFNNDINFGNNFLNRKRRSPTKNKKSSRGRKGTTKVPLGQVVIFKTEECWFRFNLCFPAPMLRMEIFVRPGCHAGREDSGCGCLASVNVRHAGHEVHQRCVINIPGVWRHPGRLQPHVSHHGG